MAHLEEVIVKPLITEKTSEASDKTNRYSFLVNFKANKNQIKLAVETLYNVKVTGVNTSISPGKTKRVGRTIKKGPKAKRAMVQLSEGQKIEFFTGV